MCVSVYDEALGNSNEYFAKTYSFHFCTISSEKYSVGHCEIYIYVYKECSSEESLDNKFLIERFNKYDAIILDKT